MHKLSWFLILFFLLISLKKETEELIRFEKNIIHERTPLLERILSRLQNDSLSPASVFHIGDSHIEMRAFSEGICEALKHESITLGRGWFMPGGIFQGFLHDPFFIVDHQQNAFRTDNILSLKTDMKLGITGRSFMLDKQQNRITVSSREDFREIEILHDTRSDLLISAGKARNSNIVITSRELSEKLTVTKITFPETQKNGELSFSKTDKNPVCFYAFRVAAKPLTYSNFGVSGAKYADFFRADLWKEQLRVLKPDLLLVTLGTNDSYYQKLDTLDFGRSLRDFVRETRRLSPQTELILMTTPDTRYLGQNPPYLAYINRQIKSCSRELNVPYWDWYEVMGGENSILNWENSPYCNGDYLHFTREAYHLFGQAFVEALFKESKK